MIKATKTIVKTSVLAKALYGKIRLEHSPEKGFIVTFWIVKLPFWIGWEMFDRVHEKFAEIVKIKETKKSNGKQETLKHKQIR